MVLHQRATSIRHASYDIEQRTTSYAPCRRRSVRRAVQLPCELTSRRWRGTVAHRLLDLSPYGAWIAGNSLDLGERVIVGFRPPRWGRSEDMMLLARVCRMRAASREHVAGMAVEFLDVDPEEHVEMQAALAGIPPRLPLRTTYLEIDYDAEPDDELLGFHALAPLLSG
jgi:hypothetical protein